MSRPSWSPNHQQGQPDDERSYPERYIFLALFILLFIRLLKTLQKYRPQEQFDPVLDELDPEATPDLEAGRISTTSIDNQAVYWDDDAGQSIRTSPGGTYHIRGRSNDDLYETALSSLASLENHSLTPTVPEHRVRDVHRIQTLVAKLRAASYAAQNDPEDSPGRLEVASLRRQITDIALNVSSGVVNPLPPRSHTAAIMDPPPAYHDVIHNNDCSTAAILSSDSTLSASLISTLDSDQ